MPRIFFAGGVVSAHQEYLLTAVGGVRARLLSYADVATWGKDAFAFWTSDRAPAPFFLDSGAFSAHTRRVVIDLNAYCDYIQQHRDRLCAYASLDVIGNWRASAVNYDVMRGKGLQPIPTFHMGSPEHELHRLLRETDYLALGGLVGAGRTKLQPWLDAVGFVVHDYWPKRIHLFGITAQWALERYPLYSADSTTALAGAGRGLVLSFNGSRLRSTPWRQYGRETGDTLVMDGISAMRIDSGSAHRGRTLRNIECMLTLQHHVTELWSARDITWSHDVGDYAATDPRGRYASL